MLQPSQLDKTPYDSEENRLIEPIFEYIRGIDDKGRILREQTFRFYFSAPNRDNRFEKGHEWLDKRCRGILHPGCRLKISAVPGSCLRNHSILQQLFSQQRKDYDKTGKTGCYNGDSLQRPGNQGQTSLYRLRIITTYGAESWAHRRDG